MVSLTLEHLDIISTMLVENHPLTDLTDLQKMNLEGIKHHIPIFKTRDNVIKTCIDDGTLKDSLENTLENAETAYKENPDLFPRTKSMGISKMEIDGVVYRVGVLKQDHIPEAVNGTLAHYLMYGWDTAAVDVVLNKLDLLQSRYSEQVKYPIIDSFEGFIEHEQEYNKRWNAPFAEYCLNELKQQGEEFLDEVVLDVKKESQTLTKITREFAPRNILVNGEMFTFDTELYGIGHINMEHGVMVSQLLNTRPDMASAYLNHVGQRYGEHIKNEILTELIAYRGAELLKEKKGLGDNREEYHRIQLKLIVDMWKNEILDKSSFQTV